MTHEEFEREILETFPNRKLHLQDCIYEYLYYMNSSIVDICVDKRSLKGRIVMRWKLWDPILRKINEDSWNDMKFQLIEDKFQDSIKDSLCIL